jgi:hypothetical protein
MNRSLLCSSLLLVAISLGAATAIGTGPVGASQSMNGVHRWGLESGQDPSTQSLSDSYVETVLGILGRQPIEQPPESRSAPQAVLRMDQS